MTLSQKTTNLSEKMKMTPVWMLWLTEVVVQQQRRQLLTEAFLPAVVPFQLGRRLSSLGVVFVATDAFSPTKVRLRRPGSSRPNSPNWDRFEASFPWDFFGDFVSSYL